MAANGDAGVGPLGDGVLDLFSLLPRALTQFLVLPGSCHPFAFLLGHDLCLCPLWQFCGLRRPRQHVLHLQPQVP